MTGNRTYNKVFCVGMPKTGNHSLCAALMRLGFKTKHHSPIFADKMYVNDSNFGKGWDATTNFGELQYAWLDDVFPKSKFILTERNIDNWINSVQAAWKDKCLKTLRPSPANQLNRMSVFRALHISNRNLLKEAYVSHSLSVKNYFKDRPDDLLVINICENGKDSGMWRVICDFLRMDAPSGDFLWK